MSLRKIYTPNKATPQEIVRATAKLWGIDEQVIIAKGRTQPEAFVRQVAMSLCYKLTNLSLTNIGRIFSNRNHATILHAIKTVERAKQTSQNLKTCISELEKHLAKNQNEKR
jgi:chromosomal replication initiator protein